MPDIRGQQDGADQGPYKNSDKVGGGLRAPIDRDSITRREQHRNTNDNNHGPSEGYGILRIVAERLSNPRIGVMRERH